MPEETAQEMPAAPKVVDLNKTPKQVQITQKKLIVVAIALALLFLITMISAYYIGVQSGTELKVAKEKNGTVATKSAQKKQTNEQTATLGEKVSVESGITIQLTEAKIDEQYEQSKQEQKDYYLKTASHSAYLNSDYFHQSNLLLKITLTNNNKSIITYNPADFRLKDSQDNQYVTPYLGEGQKVNFYSLNPSETTKITTSYIIPDSEKSFKLIYENAVIRFSI